MSQSFTLQIYDEINGSRDQFRRAQKYLGNPTESDGIIATYVFPSYFALQTAADLLFETKERFVFDVEARHKVQR